MIINNNFFSWNTRFDLDSNNVIHFIIIKILYTRETLYEFKELTRKNRFLKIAFN